MVSADVTVVIPSIPPRQALLGRALQSAFHQTLPAAAVAVVVDTNHAGAAITRHRGLEMVSTEWAAFLDDDDMLDPHHLETLVATALEYEADYVWSRFRLGFPDGRVMDGPAPLGPGSFDQWSDDAPAQTTITTLVRTKLALDVGGFAVFTDDEGKQIDGQRYGEDFDFTLRMRKAGAVFRHAPTVSWTWWHHGRNTSGRGDRW
jgi:glycosyltransferase involved in cell wall biosynthesis